MGVCQVTGVHMQQEAGTLAQAPPEPHYREAARAQIHANTNTSTHIVTHPE